MKPSENNSMDKFDHELKSYKNEILKLQKEIEHPTDRKEIDNLTHFSLGISNRANLMVIGLCSLVEVFLYEIAANEEQKKSFKIEDLKGQGLNRLQTYLTRTGKIDFGKIGKWGTFTQIYNLRHALVHSYGGLVETSFIDKVEIATKELNIESALVGGRRIRLTTDILLSFHKIIEMLFDELKSILGQV